jgi:uncharacterized cupin superfamily protein
MSRHIFNIDEAQPEERPAMFQPTGDAKQRFASLSVPIASKIGAKMLGYNVTVVPAGKRAFPLHHHHANEEMFFILQGRGHVRIGAERLPIRPGDVIACPPGGKEVAHQIINTGTEEMRYLAVSTMVTPEAVEYPDSNKFAVMSRQVQADGTLRVLRQVTREDRAVDYWDGE